MSFKKAVKHESKLRMALAGPAGSGKTYSALAIATTLANGDTIAVIDTERGSASKYADIFDFDVVDLDTFHPDKYIAAIQEAVSGGYAVLIIDSLSQAWNGVGGLLELHEQITRRQKVANSYTAWADVTPIQNRLINAIVQANIHIIATMRSKTEYVLEKDANGKSVPRKAGMAPIQRDGMEYEFDVFGEIDQEHSMFIQKTRCPALTDLVIEKPGKQVADILTEWLKGVPVTEQPVQATSIAPTQQTQPAKQQPHNRLPLLQNQQQSKPEPVSDTIKAIVKELAELGRTAGVTGPVFHTYMDSQKIARTEAGYTQMLNLFKNNAQTALTLWEMAHSLPSGITAKYANKSHMPLNDVWEAVTVNPEDMLADVQDFATESVVTA